ncbi:MAG: patatin-like phospholipase family protein [bacterium]|nr:patatin-like phospholipase family protein [bacterium]
MNKIDAVFEGGGVKGIALVGAVSVIEEHGFQFENVAGTSAGAIVACLIAAGYTAGDLKNIIQRLDYRKFQDKGWLDKLPGLGPALSLGFEKGIYEGKFFESWLQDLLDRAPRGRVKKFKDLIMDEYKNDPRFRYKLQVIAADITRGKMLILPRDIVDYGILPDELDVALAVRMSMSIPFFYEPVILKDTTGTTCYIVDGGILSNFPVWLMDDGTDNPPWPTFGFKLVGSTDGKPKSINGPITMFAALFETMMEAHDAYHLAEAQFARTIPIPTLGVGTTEFNLSREKSRRLFESGVLAARKFLQGWDFEQYKKKYRQKRA